MRKILLISFIILCSVAIGVTLISCNDAENAGFTIELVDGKDYFEFTVGSIDWNLINFNVYDSENVFIGTITATQSMVYADDLAKLNSSGTKTITINYQGASLQVTFKLNDPVYIRTYKVIFNAGEGTFNHDGIATEGSNISVINDDVIEAIPTPVRLGYEFAGWYEDELCNGAKIITPYVLKRDLVLYAKWTDERRFNVTYYRYQDNVNKGIIQTVENVEYGTDIELIAPQSIQGYDFYSYKISNGTNFTVSNEILFEEGKESYSYNITENISVILQYNTKMLTFTYISDAWGDAQVVNGIKIVGGIYSVQIPYGTELIKDINPIPVLPEKEGHTGVWIDDATNKEPVYFKATSDMLVRANYTINKYVMSFYDENDVLIPNTERVVEHNSYIETEPNVPPKTGHDGYWLALLNNELVSVSLKNIKMTSDVQVYARYTPKSYTINFHFKMDGMSTDTVETLVKKYGEVVSTPVDLTVDKEIGGVLYEGYDAKYYDILWYATSALQTEVKFPVDVVGNANYYFKLVQRPYVVDFTSPAEFQQFGIVSESISVNVGSNVTPPSWETEAYEIKGWYYDAFAPEFDESLSYEAGDIVFYVNRYYKALNSSQGKVPSENGADWTVTTDNRRYYVSGDIRDGIAISDFHEYNDNKYLDRSFYPIFGIKQFVLSFNNLSIALDDNGGYVYNYTSVLNQNVEYGKVGLLSISNIANLVLTTPTYPNGQVSSFVFEGWYTDNKFTSLPVDLETIEVKESINLYAKWVDELVGTDGLVYTPFEMDGDEIVSYQVSGFNSDIAEYSHIKMRIPETYNGVDVVAIGAGAFNDFTKVLFIDEIVLSKNVKVIGEGAFDGCYNLQNFVLSDQNTYLKLDEFGVLYSYDGTILYSIAPQNTNFVDLEEYEIPSTVEIIFYGAFATAKNLNSITFENDSNCLTIGKYAFDGCKGLVSIIIPDSVVTIDDYAFRGCYSLENIAVSSTSSLTNVGNHVFEDCTNSLNVNGDYLMLGNVLIKYLGDAEELTLDESIVAIADGAFNRSIDDENPSNYKLAKLVVGSNSNLKYIGNDVFLSCSSLTEIYILTNSMVEIESSSYSGIALSSKLYVSQSIVESYKADANYLAYFDAEFIIGV